MVLVLITAILSSSLAGWYIYLRMISIMEINGLETLNRTSEIVKARMNETQYVLYEQIWWLYDVAFMILTEGKINPYGEIILQQKQQEIKQECYFGVVTNLKGQVIFNFNRPKKGFTIAVAKKVASMPAEAGSLKGLLLLTPEEANLLTGGNFSHQVLTMLRVEQVLDSGKPIGVVLVGIVLEKNRKWMNNLVASTIKYLPPEGSVGAYNHTPLPSWLIIIFNNTTPAVMSNNKLKYLEIAAAQIMPKIKETVFIKNNPYRGIIKVEKAKYLSYCEPFIDIYGQNIGAVYIGIQYGGVFKTTSWAYWCGGSFCRFFCLWYGAFRFNVDLSPNYRFSFSLSF
jgi:hypothetical protein